ncbi:galactokinase [Kitasatospora cineracea]|uniref:Galactokinase n=2 Tax=Kitasatospora cineracea TaxID=88074 RepID=A0A8G1XGK4_9ACTN|nr:galactokinase [Kitasatospora cineracea]
MHPTGAGGPPTPFLRDDLFARRPPAGLWSAPARVGLLGEPTGHNGGFALRIALPQNVRAAVRPHADGVLRVHNARYGGTVILRIAKLRPDHAHGPARHVAALVHALRGSGCPVEGADVSLDGDLPAGPGPMPSGALCSALALAFNDLYGLGLDRTRLARLAQYAAHGSGRDPDESVDRLAAFAFAPGHALLLDTRRGTTRPLPLAPAAAGLQLLVVEVRAAADGSDGVQARWRATSGRAAQLLGLPALRDLAPGRLPAALGELPPRLRGPVHHAVTENTRVLQAAALLDEGRPAALGPLLTGSHYSLRDHCGISRPEATLAVEAALEAGALGARLADHGTGGKVVVLTPGVLARSVTSRLRQSFARAGHPAPRITTGTPAAGARRLH